MKNNIIIVFIACLFFLSCKEDRKKQEERVVEQKPAKNVQVPAYSPDSAYYFVKKQVDFGPRVPNTGAHRKCGDFLISTLNGFGAKVNVQSFQATAFDGTVLNLRNIMGSINPDATKRILLAAHWDSRPFADADTANVKTPILGANDGASGVGVLLEIARVISLAKSKPEVGVDIIFFDGEDYGQPEFYQGKDMEDSWCLGSQYWSKNKGNYTAYYGILLDMVGAKGAKFAMEGTSMQYAPTVVQKVWDAGNKIGYSHHFVYNQTGAITDDHAYVNHIAKIPMIDIIEYEASDGIYFGHYWHTHKDNMDIIDKTT